MKKFGKLALIIGALCLVFIVTIGFITDKQKNNDTVNAQSNDVNNELNEGINKESDSSNMNNDDSSDVSVDDSKESQDEVSMQELRASEEDIELSSGEQHQLSVVGLLSDGSEIDLTNDDKLISHSDNEEKIAVLDGQIVVSEDSKTGVKAVITIVYEGHSATVNVKVKQSLEDTVTVNESGKQIVTNYADIDVLVNKQRSLPSNYIPEDLVKPNVPFSFKGENEKRYLRKEAAEALEKLFEQAKQDSIKIVAVSGYRSYKRQETIFNYKVKTRGFEAASKVSAQPGQSEHQTGLAMDVSCAAVGYKLEEKFGELKEGIWVKENAHQYGFIIRYQEGKEHITGYQYEPWHLRYVGEELAKDIYEQGLTYEEYMELK